MTHSSTTDKSKITKRIVSFTLAILMLLSAVPLATIEAFAASFGKFATSELDPADYDAKISNGHYVMDLKDYENQSAIAPHWAKPHLERALSMGVLYGSDVNGAYMPLEELIDGRDSMALALFYYYGKNSNNYLVYSGASGSGWSARQDTYKNAAAYFRNATNANRDGRNFTTILSNIANASSYTRKDAFLLIAFCVQQESGGRAKLTDYSDTEFAKMADGKTFIRGWNDSIKEFDDKPGQPMLDWQDIENRGYPGYYIQAMNMLMDLGTLRGKTNNAGTWLRIQMDDIINYTEFITLLVQLDDSVDDFEPTPYSEIDPRLNVYANDTTISYRDFLDGTHAGINVTLDASATSSRQPITNYKFQVEDTYDDQKTSSTSSKSKSFTYYYRASDVGFTSSVAQQYRGERTYTIRYDGKVTVTDSLGTTANANDYDNGTLKVVNYAPTSGFTVTSDNLTGGSYGSSFFYVGEPITIHDTSSDYENALTEWYYTIKYNGGTIASSDSFDDVRITATGESYISDFTPSFADKDHSITFSKKGTYTIEAYVVDEMGKQSSVTRKTITVSGEPEPPTAIIEGNDYTYSNYDTTLTDASTDPNNDIVKWEWGEVWWFDEVLDENGDGTGEGEWINVTGKIGGKDDENAYYNGTFNNVTRNPNGAYNVATATMQFTHFGTYRIYETVTDATGLSDTTYHEITVLEDIPVIVVDPDPVPPQEGVTYIVTFINTDGTKTTVEVPAGSYVTPDQVPAIVDVDGLYEHGWTQDGTKLVEPTEVKVNGNLTFVVYTTPEDENSTVHTVTFINTDGTTTTVKVPHNGNLTDSDVPNIIDLPSLVELGWTLDDEDTVNPTTVTIDRDMVFWVKTEPVEDDSHTIIFINTDGSVTVIEVPDGQPIPADEIPGIIDMPGLIENGWTSDGGDTIVPDPSTIYPEGDMVFRVDTDPEEDNSHTVTFINTDGTVTTITVPDGEKIPFDKIPGIVDIPKLDENGWTPDGGENVYSPEDVADLPVTGDMVFTVDTDPQKDTHTVIFVNTDGTITVVEVPDGETVPPELIPDIVDMPGITENGWVENGDDEIVDPSDIPITEDTIFVVDKDPDDDNVHTVTFINTDGTVTVIQIPDGETIGLDKIPGIVDIPDLVENGWTNDGGDNVYTPEEISETPITKDEVFYVDTDIIPDDSHTVTFINTDGTVTTIIVPNGEKIPADKVPDIVDVDGIIENGWTDDGENVVTPAGTVVDKDLVFWVQTEPEDDDDDTVTVTFINTDGTTTTVEIPKGGFLDPDDVPDIIDLDDFIENGWTTDGETIVDPTGNPIDEDTVFWVDKDPDEVERPEDGLPYYDGEGRLVIKQNRAAVIDATQSLSPPNDPIQVEKTEWVLEGVDGYDVDNVKFSGGKPSGLETIFIAKEPGEFTVTITLHNNYSDQLAQEHPNSSKLEARTATITVIVYPDEPPEANLFVNNANPNFHTNPVSTDITVASSAISPDGDIISKYEWNIVRDMDNDGDYTDEEPFYVENGSNLGTVTFPVEFQSGIVGKFLAKLKVTESSGQKTLPEYMTEEDNLYTEVSKEFEVNWTPCIEFDFLYNGNAWAYVDDTIPIIAHIKDENTSTCEVEWTLKKKVGSSYVPVNTSEFDVWDFGSLGGELLIPEDGYYVLEAVITDDHGYSETFVSNEIRIYDLPTAVITDDPEYRWMETQWQYKQSRRFDVDGKTSYADDDTGPALHQIDHALDAWSITPISDGASADAIYVLADDGTSRLESEESTYFFASKNEFDEAIAIIEPGTYRIGYQVTNTYGKKSDVVYQTITIIEDCEPIINIGTPASHEYLGSAANDAYVTIGMSNVHVLSDDMDVVGNYENFIAEYRYDSDNDGDYEDEEWVECEIRADSNLGKTELELSMTADVNQVGWYQFHLHVAEGFGQPTLDTIIPEDCYLKYDFYHEVEVDNSRPQGTFDVSNNVYGDIVFAMGKSQNVAEVSEKTQNFENSFGEVEGANVFQLDVQTIETSSVNLADGIAWNESQMSSRIGYITKSTDGLNVNMYGNPSYAGQNILYTLDYEGKISFAFDYNLSFGDSFNGAGVVVNLADVGNQLKATLIWIPNGGRALGQAGIYDITYTKGSNGNATPASYRRIQGFNLSTYGRLEIESNAGTISVTGSGVGNNVYTVTTEHYGDGFGFYSSHYSHGCDEIGNFSMTNIQLGVTVQRTLAESLTDVSFNSNHDVFVIWTEDTISQELDKTSPTYEEDYAELLSLLVSQNIHLIILGSDENKDEMQALLDQCLVPGIFIDEDTVDNDLDAARDFIAACLREQSDTNVKYVLVNEESLYNKYYTDFNGHDHWYAGGYETDEDGNLILDEEGNPIGVDNILSSKWWYRHEPDYFMNSMGLYTQNEVWQADEVTMFTETGRYYVDYKVKDNSVPDAWLDDNSTGNPFDEYRYWSNNYGNDEYDEKGNLTNQYAEIFVHRRPLAEFDFTAHMSDTEELEGITVFNDAYDLDHYEAGNPKSHPTRGLQQYEWTWQLADDPSTKTTAMFTDVSVGQKWINEQLASIEYDSTTNVLISYRVRDIDGVVHEEEVVYHHQIGAINGDAVYLAPKNSYHHTKLDEDLIVDGKVVAPAGTWVTTDYEEAVSELRAALVKAEQELTEATADYNSKEAIAQQADKDATAAEEAADDAEELRDEKQEDVDEQEIIVAGKKTAFETATKNANTAYSNYETAKGEADSALEYYEQMNSDYLTKKSTYDTAYGKYTAENDVQADIQEKIDELEAQYEAEEITEEEYNEQLNALNTEMQESKTRQTTIWNDEVLPAKEEMDKALSIAETAKKTYESKKSTANSLYQTYLTENGKKETAEKELESARGTLNTLNGELTKLKQEATDARNEATRLRKESDDARKTADTAKSVMETAEKKRDAAKKELDDFTYLTNDQTVWVTSSEKMEIPDGVWSFYNTVRVSGNPIAPVAKFVTNKIYYDINEDIQITDQSYSPNGNNITTWKWTITGGADKVEETITYTTIPGDYPEGSGTVYVSSVTEMERLISEYVTDLVNSHQLGMTNADNTYRIELVVTDDKSVPMESDPYAVSIVITPSNTPPTIDPNNPQDPEGSDDDDKNTSIYRKNNLIVYEYDDYDANVVNDYYTYNGQPQYRGSETLDWTVILDDPDNHDQFGTANDTVEYTLDYLLERFEHQKASTVLSNLTTSEQKEYGPFLVTAAEALVNANVAPFTTVKDGNIEWGAYRITTTVTDNPLNGTPGKSASIVTQPDVPPKHLYVVPKLEIGDFHFMWEGQIDTEEQVPVGDSITITLTTNNETTAVYSVMPNGDGGENRTKGTLVRTEADGTKVWTITAVIPDTLEEEDLVDGKGYTFYAETQTTYGSEDGTTVMRTKREPKHMNVLAIKLFDFRVTNVTDPAVDFDIANPVTVPHLAYDETNSPAGELMKKGYSFYFELSSMGLKGDSDSVRITPKFYTRDASGVWQELDVYYKNDNGDYVLGTYDPDEPTAADDTFIMYASGQNGSELGTMRELMLDDDDRTIEGTGSTQTWYGRYGLPSTAVFVKKDQSLSSRNLVEGPVLVTFEMEAMKNGTSKYQYIGRGQWNLERRDENGNYIDVSKAYYMDGSIIVIDGDRNAMDNYNSLPVWRQTD